MAGGTDRSAARPTRRRSVVRVGLRLEPGEVLSALRRGRAVERSGRRDLRARGSSRVERVRKARRGARADP